MGVFCDKWTSNARMDGKTAVITGCNTGIGKETVQDFYQRGCKVIMACRNTTKAEEAAKDIEAACKDKSDLGKIVIEELDLTSLQSVRDCAQKILSSESHIELLINNAGVMMCPQSKTADGFEMQFGTNHLGHFLFTLLLLPGIIKSAPARIVIVSALAHINTKMDFDDLNSENKPYSAMFSYQQSKLANILFGKELATRLEAANITGVTTYSLHPGVIKTDLGRHLSDTMWSGAAWMWHTFSGYFIKTPLEGAQTTIYCAVDEECGNETGLYYSDCSKTKPSKAARDSESAKKLWDLSIQMVGLDDNYNPFKAQ